MTDFLSKYDSGGQPVGRVEQTLNDLVKQLNLRWNPKRIVAIVVKSSGDLETYITYALHLTTPKVLNYYSYRYIQIKQPVDNEFPIKVTAFQNPPLPETAIHSTEALTDWLIDIVGDIRTRIVENHLENVNQSFDDNID